MRVKCDKQIEFHSFSRFKQFLVCVQSAPIGMHDTRAPWKLYRIEEINWKRSIVPKNSTNSIQWCIWFGILNVKQTIFNNRIGLIDLNGHCAFESLIVCMHLNGFEFERVCCVCVQVEVYFSANFHFIYIFFQIHC